MYSGECAASRWFPAPSAACSPSLTLSAMFSQQCTQAVSLEPEQGAIKMSQSVKQYPQVSKQPAKWVKGHQQCTLTLYLKEQSVCWSGTHTFINFLVAILTQMLNASEKHDRITTGSNLSRRTCFPASCKLFLYPCFAVHSSLLILVLLSLAEDCWMTVTSLTLSRKWWRKRCLTLLNTARVSSLLPPRRWHWRKQQKWQRVQKMCQAQCHLENNRSAVGSAGVCHILTPEVRVQSQSIPWGQSTAIV